MEHEHPQSRAPDAWRLFFEDPGALSVPWVESPFFEPLLAARGLSEEDRELARRFREDGYVILEDAIDPARIDAVVAEYPRLFAKDARFEGIPRHVREVFERDPTRKQDAWHVSEPVRALAADEKILAVLRLFYGREPIPFQTLNFLPGTQQSLHSDAMHFSSIPARFMCGVWVALEDATSENGPLRYVPGSHRFSETTLESLGLWGEEHTQQLGEGYARYEQYLEALVRLHDLPVKTATIRKGSAFVWAANLIHGGAPIRKAGSTRMSQVTHYYFENCVYYTPIFSNAALGEIYLRDVHDVRTGERVLHRLNGARLSLGPLPCGRSRVWRSDSVSAVQRWIRKYLGRI
jgi:ectoine hydroxylase-related dioxygenase (phytanoyl-CoA dioxygenase family)